MGILEWSVNYTTVAGWNTQTVTPTQVGFYKAIGVITCSEVILSIRIKIQKK